MSTTTATPVKGWAEALADMIDYHKEVLVDHGMVLNGKGICFGAKKQFTWSRTPGGHKEPCFYLQPWDGVKPVFIVEFMDAKYNAFEPRQLYKFLGNENFTEEHQEAEYGYRVYLDELIKLVPAPVKPIQSFVAEPETFVPDEVEERKFGIKYANLTHMDFLAMTHMVECADHKQVNLSIRNLLSTGAVKKAA